MKERELVFRPIREAAGWYSGMPDGAQELYLPLGEGAETQRIHAWWWPDDDPKAPVVYYLHGARWNLTGHLSRISQLRRFGFSVFAIDYRGFGKSDGDVPSEASVYEDARAGWQWLVRREPDASRRFIYGHSLGGAIAVDLAVRLSVEGAGARGLIVESSFTSLADMAAELSNGWLPGGLLLSQKFDSIEKIRQIRMPVLIVHGASDRYVPVALQRSALRGGARAEEAADRPEREPQQQHAGRATPITGKRCARSSGRSARRRRRLRTLPRRRHRPPLAPPSTARGAIALY